MVTSADYPPFESIDTASGGQIVGFDVDIANYVGEKLGYEIKVVNQDFNGLIPALQAGRADFVMAGMTPTEERLKSADFSTIYYQAKNTIVAKKGSNYINYDALAGKRVAVQLGSIQENEAKKAAEKVQGLTVVPLNRIGEIIQEIKANRIDGAIIEDTVAKGYIESNPDLEFNTVETEGPSGSAIAFPKGSPLVSDFNRVLEEMKSSGEIDRLAKKWFEKQ
ncbi:transporter substrate-binding domain-containing protein [Leptolyngbya sp. FACHB-261]|uniref:transporter substrate-binding domain-containing protein n=1 Tax=Leptolyngbya sp. FACHB-261 TaxID=2692806 RepID=UPI001F559ACA|nr:transporter substrate-binding domain-containing protein [Leptolyngbya sp. FACHB-261]